MAEHICNAIIESASIQLDRGVFLCVWLTLDFGGLGQGFGGYVLGGKPDTEAGKHAEQPNLCGEFIVKCLMAAGVEKFSDLRGKTIRVKRTESGFGGSIIAIGHIVKDDLWFDPKAAFAALGVKS